MAELQRHDIVYAINLKYRYFKRLITEHKAYRLHLTNVDEIVKKHIYNKKT